MYRFRHTTIFCAIGVLTTTLIFGILQSRVHSRSRTPASVMPPARPAPHVEPAICKHLYRVICQRQGQTRRDPTGLVRPDVQGERIVASIYKAIIRAHPGWTSQQVDDELAREVYTPERRGRIEAAYHWVQDRLVEFINSQPNSVFTAREKNELVSRVMRTKLDIPPPASVYADEPDLLMANDVFYERTSDGKLRMRVGGAYLFTAKSWFNMVFTMGHELGHSIDPCEVRNAQLSFPAYDRLEACFLKTGIVAMPPDRVECAQNDQLSEAFADWIGAKITSEALKNFSTVYQGAPLVNSVSDAVRDLCLEPGDDEDLDIINHPPPHVRIERIFGDQPTIRAVLGCSAPAPIPYCGFQSDVSNFSMPSKKKVSL